MIVLGWVGALALMVLPGAWVAFGSRSAWLGFWSRIALAIVLSPFIVFVQYTLLRWVGLAFGATIVVLAVLNAPAVLLLWKDRPAAARPAAGSVLLWGACLLLPLAFLFYWDHDPQIRAKWGHSWTHTDIIYMLANHAGHPEEPQLAGIRLAYPWGANAYQGALSWLFDSSPNQDFLWTNILWFAALAILVARIVRELGGDRIAGATALIWLSFGVNAVGYAGRKLIPGSFRGAYPIFGDNRYTPWLRKFGIFEASALGIAMVAAIAWLAIQPRDPARRGTQIVLTATLLTALGIMYPLIFPAGLILVGARLLVDLATGRPQSGGRDLRELAGTAGSIVVAMLACVAFVEIVTVDRAAGPALGLSTFWNIKVKSVESVIVLLPLLLALLPWAWSRERLLARPAVTLILAGLGCITAYIVLDVYHIANEYKFILAAALCFTPFAAIGFTRLRARLGRAFAPVFVAVALALAFHGFHQIRGDLASPRFKAGMRVDLRHFSFRLDDDERHAAVTDAIRLRAPGDAVLLAGPDSMDYTTLTRRATYVPYVREMLFGVGIPAEGLLKSLRGYDAELFERRLSLLETVYTAAQDADRSLALRAIGTEVGRPLAIMLDDQRDAPLAAWLGSLAGAERIHDGDGLEAWIVPAPDGSRNAFAPAQPRDRAHR